MLAAAAEGEELFEKLNASEKLKKFERRPGVVVVGLVFGLTVAATFPVDKGAPLNPRRVAKSPDPGPGSVFLPALIEARIAFVQAEGLAILTSPGSPAAAMIPLSDCSACARGGISVFLLFSSVPSYSLGKGVAAGAGEGGGEKAIKSPLTRGFFGDESMAFAFVFDGETGTDSGLGLLEPEPATVPTPTLVAG